MARYSYATVLICLGLATGLSAAFQPPFQATKTGATATTTTLWGKVKRGKLGLEVDEAVAPPPRSSSNQKKTKRSVGSAKSSSSSGNISPALAEWMASQEQEQPPPNDSKSTTTDDDSALTYTSFEDDSTKGRSKSRKKSSTTTRVNQSARKAAEDARDERVEQIVQQLQDVLENKSGDGVNNILALVRELMQLPTANFKQLTAGAQRQDFRLAWVGSDDAICHVGTGLHKVPLARLQEVFLSFIGRNRIEMQEVIRILGPFPNVKNTLQGQSSFNRQPDNAVVEWQLTWDSMVDGTGKEILAGKEENVRRVDLQVYFSNPSVVVAVVPPPESENNAGRLRTDPLQENGKHVLLFVREDNLMDQLEMLRVG